MKPIETTYRGCRFRSRLEARWAVFFDFLEIEWRYEPERYGTELSTYLPDFYLPRTKTWVEVKGEADALQKDWQRMSGLLDFGGVLPDFADSYVPSSSRGLVLLGEVPDVQGWQGVVAHPIVQHHKGLHRTWVIFTPRGPEPLVLGWLAQDLLGLHDESELEAGPSAGWLVESHKIPTPYVFRHTLVGYRHARAARFEHGDDGRWAVDRGVRK